LLLSGSNIVVIFGLINEYLLPKHMDIFNQIIARNQSILVTLAEIAVFTVFISLIIYHIVIYLGRRYFPEGKLYLYMSMLLTGLLLYLFLDTNMYYIIVSLIIDTGKWTSFFTAISWLLIFKGIQLLVNDSLNPSEQVKLFVSRAWYIYLCSSVVWMAPALPAFTRYHRDIFIFFWAFNGFFIGFYSIVYLKLLVNRSGKTERGIYIIGITALLYIIYIWFYRLAITIYPIHLLLPFWLFNNLLKIGVAFTFAFALAVRFNREFSDLMVLKDELEKRVAEKTSELFQANRKIEAASKIKTDYFINVAHETKTPLTLIGNYLDRYIKRHGPSEELTVIRENFNLLSEAMIRFLDAERFDKGKAGYSHDRAINLSDLINLKIPLYRELASLRNRNFIHEIEDKVILYADPVAIERIANNLFDNALKFSAEFDTISISLKKAGGKAVLKVSDTGPGIDRKSVNEIFKPYVQLAPSGQNNAGLGMGLFIVKQIIESLDGEIHVDENQGGGAIFKVIIPVSGGQIASETGPMTQPVSTGIDEVPAYQSGKKNVLIIEDNSDMLRYLVGELASCYNIFKAENGIQAFNLLKSLPAQDLILSDVMMESMDGFEFFDMISKDSRYNSIPFLFMTARSDNQERIIMLNRGVADYIFKPFSTDELKARIKSALKNAEKQRKSGISEAIETLNSRLKTGTPNRTGDKWEIFAIRTRDYQLTGRQVEIIKEVEKGLEYKLVAEKLNISPKTVHRHMQILFDKFNVHSKIELLKTLFE
jgi:signal transduction histidine kinase/DNA-binding NarL/FixJ family response regulator